MKRLITALLATAMITYAVLFAYLANADAELLDAVIRVPQDLDTSDPAWQELNSGASYELYRTDAEWADGGIAPGSVKINPYKIIVSSLDVDGDSPAEMLDTLFIAYGLDWTLLGLKTFIPVLVSPPTDTYYRTPLEADVFPFIIPRPVWDCSTEPCTQTGVQLKNCNQLPAWGNSKFLHWQCN